MSRFRDPDAPKKFAKAGRMTESRDSWVQLNETQAVLYVHPNDAEDGEHNALVLLFYKPGAPKVSLNLTKFTRPELEALKEFVVGAIDRAIPISDDLDRQAKEAWDSGDDSYTRAYRGLPQVHVRQRALREHDESVPSGPDGTAGGAGEAAVNPGRPGSRGGAAPD